MSAAASPAGSAAPESTPTPDTNLLSFANGAIVRSYPTGIDDPTNIAEKGGSVDGSVTSPVVIAWELPGVATLDNVTVSLPGTDVTAPPSATVSISTTSATGGFADLGSVTEGSDDTTKVLSAGGRQARWIRVTSGLNGTALPYDSIVVSGRLAPRPSGAPTVSGMYYELPDAYANGAPAPQPTGTNPTHLRVVTIGAGGISGQECDNNTTGDAFPGTFDGRVWTWTRSNASGRFVLNDEGTMLIGTNGDQIMTFLRASDTPTRCKTETIGTGKTNVLVLSPDFLAKPYPLDESDVPANIRFSRLAAALLDQSALDSANAAILLGLCTGSDYLSAAQGQALMNWVAAGHKLLISDSDMCDQRTSYPFLPYTFVSDNPGARGAHGDRLIEVESDSLGSLDRSDRAHFFDPRGYAADSDNQLGDANTVTSRDSHWCGHLFGTNADNVNGFMQMYTTWRRGLIVYDGFDEDDSTIAGYRRVRDLELAQPIPADLPCTQQVSLAFVIEPNQTGSFVPGRATTLSFPMEVLANQGWRGHVAIATTGNFATSVTPSAFDIAGGTQQLAVRVAIPSSAKPGQYAVIVNGNGGGGQTAQATIALNAAVPLAKQLKTQRRIRIYGIHFDVDKATIKPQSEAVIAQIAQILKQYPRWRLRVEGHTDSQGGYRYNMVLSQKRAQAVVDDLVRRYHVARSRLVPVGYGYSHPVATNATAAGRALNRRVELVRI